MVETASGNLSTTHFQLGCEHPSDVFNTDEFANFLGKQAETKHSAPITNIYA